jgi:Uma2 family endonuclease
MRKGWSAPYNRTRGLEKAGHRALPITNAPQPHAQGLGKGLHPTSLQLIRRGRYMIPDVCVIRAPRPAEKVFDKPPLIWIEILSPEDRPIRVNEKIRELREFGVPNIWVIDPQTFEAEVHSPEGTSKIADGILRVPGTPIKVPFQALDRD